MKRADLEHILRACRPGHSTRVRARAGVARIFNLLYRRFGTCEWFRGHEHPADCKSAVRQVGNPRYGLAPRGRAGRLVKYAGRGVTGETAFIGVGRHAIPGRFPDALRGRLAEAWAICRRRAAEPPATEHGDG